MSFPRRLVPIHPACFLLLLSIELNAASTSNLRELARNQAKVHRLSTLFTAHDVKNHLSSDEGLDIAIDWCKRTAVTKVYVEVFRDGYQAERAALQHAKEQFLKEGFDVSGCVTTTQVGKKSTRWDIIACYTDLPTQAKIQAIFEYAASLFDEIMIDDFWLRDGSWVVENFNDEPAQVVLNGRSLAVEGRGWSYSWK
jgi:hypothetical protein